MTVERPGLRALSIQPPKIEGIENMNLSPFKKKQSGGIVTTEAETIVTTEANKTAMPINTKAVYQIVFLKKYKNFRGESKLAGEVVGDATEAECEELMKTEHIKILTERKVK